MKRQKSTKLQKTINKYIDKYLFCDKYYTNGYTRWKTFIC